MLVYDSSALLAYLNNETGADVVEELLDETNIPHYVHSVNLLEIFYNIARRTDAENARQNVVDLLALGIQERYDLDAAFWQDAATIKAEHVVALGDSFGLALTRRLGGRFVTADKGDLKTATTANVCEMLLFR